MDRRTQGTAASAAEMVRQPYAQPDQRVSGLSAARELRGFRLADAAADVRGWRVIAADGPHVGTVARLIVDTRTRHVRYLGVALEPRLARSAPATGTSHTVLVPVGVAHRLDALQCVALDQLTAELLAHAPRLPQRPITRADEDATLAAYGLPTSSEMGRDHLYEMDVFDESTLF